MDRCPFRPRPSTQQPRRRHRHETSPARPAFQALSWDRGGVVVREPMKVRGLLCPARGQVNVAICHVCAASVVAVVLPRVGQSPPTAETRDDGLGLIVIRHTGRCRRVRPRGLCDRLVVSKFESAWSCGSAGARSLVQCAGVMDAGDPPSGWEGPPPVPLTTALVPGGARPQARDSGRCRPSTRTPSRRVRRREW